MNHVEYADFTASIDLYPDVVQKNAKLLFHALGLAGEAGEVANKVKKVFRDSGGEITPEIRATLAKELGGTYWYFVRAVADLGMTVQQIQDLNADELMSRRDRGVLQGSGDNR